MTDHDTKMDPDKGFVLAMAAGDPRGLSGLMDTHLSRITALAYHMLGDQMAAEDIAQEVFLKAWLKAKDWEFGNAKFITWMRRVATNQCLDKLRKRREVLSDTLPEQADNAASAESAMATGETKAAVSTALAELPDRQRAALTLSHFDHVSQSEGASILEISEAAYESLLARARRALRDILLPQKESLMEGLGQ